MAAERVIRRLLVALGIKDADKTVKGLVAVSDASNRLKENWRDLAATSATFFAGLAAGVGVLAANTLATAQDAEAIQRRSRALAMSQREYQRLLAVFEVFGADASDVNDALGTLADRAEDAKTGMQSFVDDFMLVGITLDDLKGKDPAALFELFADAIATSTDPNKALTASVRILGDDLGAKLMPMLQRGSAGLRSMANEAEHLGVVMTDQTVASSAKLAVSWRQLGQLVKGLARQVGAELSPTMQGVVDDLRSWAMANQDLIRGGIRRWAEDLKKVVDGVREGVGRLNRFIQDTIGYENALKLALATGGFAALGVFVGKLIPALDSLRQLWVALRIAAAGFGVALGPVTVVVGAALLALAGMALALNDFWVTIQGGDSLMNRFIGSFKESEGVVGAVARLLDTSMRSARAFFTIVSVGGPKLWEAFTEGMAVLKEWLLQFELVQAAADLISATFTGFGVILDTVSDKLAGLIDGYTNLFTETPLALLEGAAANLSGQQLAQANTSVTNAPVTSSSVTNNSSSSTQTVNVQGMGPRDVEVFTAQQLRQALAGTRGGMR